MPVLKKKITLPIRRNTSLFIDVEAGVTGLGGVAKGLRSRLGKRPELKGVAARLRNGGVQAPHPTPSPGKPARQESKKQTPVRPQGRTQQDSPVFFVTG